MRKIFPKEKFVVRETTIKLTANNENGLKEKRLALICVMNEDTGIVYPHPISSFTKYRYRSTSSINTQLNPTREVAKFLNYILERVANEDPLFIELRDKGIFDLKVLHGSLYITHKTREGLSGGTVQRIERYLTNLTKAPRSYYKISQRNLVDYFLFNL